MSDATAGRFHPIGTPGQAWGPDEVAEWRSRQSKQRSHAEDVLSAVARLRDRFDIVEYGVLDYPPDRYPLVAVRSRAWDDALPSVLVTGGVHGYETSGVHGALRFLDRDASGYAGRANL